MRCLVLGGNGFIGSHVVDKLLVKGHSVRVYDRASERFRPPLPDVEYIHGEFGNRGLIREALKDIDVVFHLISTTIPKTSNDDPIFDVRSNVIDTIKLLEECVVARVRRVVFASSGGVIYGIPKTNPIPESHPTNPICSHGITKLMIEKYLALFRHLYGLDYVVLRASNPYGERQNPFGEQGAIAVFLGKVARGEPIVIWGDGGVIRDYFYVGDLADAYLKAATLDVKERIFNIGSGVGTSLVEVIELIAEATGKNPEVSYTESRPFDVPTNVLDISLAKEHLGWHPHTDLVSGIKRTWKWVERVMRDR